MIYPGAEAVAESLPLSRGRHSAKGWVPEELVPTQRLAGHKPLVNATTHLP